jgi:4-hydroxybenzoate polyprenyltransferase
MENLSVEMLCPCCKTGCLETDRFCGNCGYPYQGSDEDQKQFRVNYSFNDIDKDLVNKRISEARIILFIISGFTLIQTLLLYIDNPSPAILITNLIICGIYAGLGFWAKHNPFAAILLGGLIYVSMILLSGFVDPSTLAKGIFLRIIFIIAFIRASYGAYKFKVKKMN